MLPQYERKVSDLLQTVTLGSAAAIDAPASVETGVSPVQAGSKTRPSTTASDSPDDLTSVHQRQAAMPPIILGHDMAEEIGATVGSVVLVTSPQGELTPFGMVPKYIRFHVAGIFNSGFFDYDSSWAFIRLSDAQELFGLGDVISVIQFKIDDIYQAAGVAHHSNNPPISSQEATASWPPTGWNKTSPCSAPPPRTRSHLHHHRPDRLRRASTSSSL